MFTVFYKIKNYNQSKSYFRNANRYVKSKSFKSETRAREFAVTVSAYKIVNPIGAII